MKGPGNDTIKSSGQFEGDFIGTLPLGAPNPVGTPALTESSFFTSPVFRIRHFYGKMETPYVDVLAGHLLFAALVFASGPGRPAEDERRISS